MLGTEQDARDITQETLARALKNLATYQSERPFSPWIYRIARNACIDDLRKRRTRRTSPEVESIDPGQSPLEITQEARRARRLRHALDQLPEQYKDIIVLYHFENLKYGEIADVLQIPMGTVMNRIFRARQQLRSLYEPTKGRN